MYVYSSVAVYHQTIAVYFHFPLRLVLTSKSFERICRASHQKGGQTALRLSDTRPTLYVLEDLLYNAHAQPQDMDTFDVFGFSSETLCK